MDSTSRALWEEYWHPLCHRSEVAKPRDFVRFDVGGEEVVVFNDGGRVMAFDNLCPHRGARIFDGEYGNARFLCRYHGWSYANGKVFVGDRQQFDPDMLAAACLTTYAAEWVGDLLFVSKRPARGLSEQLAEMRPILEQVSFSCGSRADFNRYGFEADWRIAVENALEPYHVGVVHPTSLDRLKLTRGENRFFGENSIWISEVGDEKVARRLARLETMFDLAFQHRGYWSAYLFPFSMISSTFGFSYSMQNFLPSEVAGRAEFTSRLYAGKMREGVNPQVLQSFFESSAAVNRQVFEEDHEICKRVPLRSWSRETPKVHARSEEKLVQFRASYRAFESAEQ